MVDLTHKRQWRVIVVENEPNIRALVKNFISRRYPDFNVIADVDNTDDAMNIIKNDSDIHGVFLDIHFDCQELSEGFPAGFDLACALQNTAKPPWVVFMTARAQEYALEAHRRRYGQIGFLNKPINSMEWDEQINWIRKNKPIPSRKITINHRMKNGYDVCTKVETELFVHDIQYVHTIPDTNLVSIHLVGGSVLDRNNCTLSWWEDELKSDDFLKINRSCIINLRHVSQLSCVEPFTVTLHAPNKAMTVASTYLNALKDALKNFTH